MDPVRGALLAALIFTFSSCGAPGASTSSGAVQITYQVKLVDGSPSWSGSQSKLTPGTQVNATLVNSLTDTHYFQVAGVSSPVEVAPGSSTQTSFTIPQAAGEIAYYCPRHDPSGAHSGIIILDPLPDPSQ